MTVINLQRENFGATPEFLEDENKEDHLIENNYENIDNAGKYPIYDLTVINLQRENFGATPEFLEDENKEDHLIDDEDDEVICID